MRSRVVSRATRTSPCLRRKPEISSAGDSAAIAGAASSRKPAITPPTARRVIVPPASFVRQTSAIPGRFSIGNVDASRHGPCVLFLAFGGGPDRGTAEKYSTLFRGALVGEGRALALT